MINFIINLYEKYLDKKEDEEKKYITSSLKESTFLINKLYKEIKVQYDNTGKSKFFLDCLAISLNQHKYIQHKELDKRGTTENSFVVINESLSGTRESKDLESRDFDFKEFNISMFKDSKEKNLLTIDSNIEKRDKKNESTIIFYFDEKHEKYKFSAWSLEKKYRKMNLNYYNSDEFKGLNNFVLEMNAALKKSIKLYSFVLRLLAEDVDSDNINQFVKEFKDTKEIFNILVPILHVYKNKYTIDFAKSAIDNGVVLSKKDIIHFIVNMGFDKKYDLYVQHRQLEILKLVKKVKNMNFLENLNLNSVLSKDLTKEEKPTNRRKI